VYLFLDYPSIFRNIETTETYTQQKHRHNRNIETTGTYTLQKHRHYRNINPTET